MRAYLKFPIILVMLVLLSACLKENGKKEYTIRLEFSSGDVWEGSCHVLEKSMKTDDMKYKGQKDVIYIDLNYGLILYKVENRFLTGVDDLSMDVSNFNMINGQSGQIHGRIEMKGEYKRHLRHYSVDNGTFDFKIAGSPFNVPDTIYSGKWTLKLK